jgi:hypothetical protein
MLPFGVTIPATVPQGSEIPEGLMNNPVHTYCLEKLGVTRKIPVSLLLLLSSSSSSMD